MARKNSKKQSAPTGLVLLKQLNRARKRLASMLAACDDTAAWEGVRKGIEHAITSIDNQRNVIGAQAVADLKAKLGIE